MFKDRDWTDTKHKFAESKSHKNQKVQNKRGFSFVNAPKHAKNLKQMITMDLGHNHAVYSAIDAGISTRQPAKFCDLVGFEGRYTDPKSGIRYYSKDQYQAITEMPQTVKDEILSVRKANIVLR